MNNTCAECFRDFNSRQGLIRHVFRSHDLNSPTYQFIHESFGVCATCNIKLNLAEVEERFRPGMKEMFCSNICSKLAKIHGPEYFKVKFNLTKGEAKEKSLQAYRSANPFRLPSSVEYWINKCCSEEEAYRKVSLSQQKTNKLAFISRYGEEEGTNKYLNFIKSRSIKYTGEGNPRYGIRYTKLNKKKHSDLMKKVMANPEIIKNILKGVENSKYISGIAEYDFIKILNKLKFVFVHQFGIINSLFIEEEKSNYFIHDFFIPNLNLIIEINEPWHNQPKHRLYDSIKRKHAEVLGYRYLEIFTTSNMELELKTYLEEK